MEWLADILKNLAISRTLIVAIFVTTTVMYFGPSVAPDYVPLLQKDHIPYLFAVMLLSGTLLVLWSSVAAWRFTHRGLKSAAQGLTGSTLSEEETAILYLIANDPTEPLNLEYIDYSRAPGTKLEFHQLTKSLERKGLVSINPWNDNLISLSERGREKALEVQRKFRGHKPA